MARFTIGEIPTTAEKVMCYLRSSRNVRPRLHELLPAAIEDAGRLAAPVLVYELHKAKTLVRSGHLVLENGLSLGLPRAERYAGTKYLAACVCSLGEAIENACREFNDAGQLLQAVLLEAVSLSLMDSLLDKCREILQGEARALHLFAGRPFSPGHRDMPMETQALLLRLVDPASARVRLNESMVMHPLKSLSFFVQFATGKVETRRSSRCCRHCPIRICPFEARRSP
jgi:hypothetical protein